MARKIPCVNEQENVVYGSRDRFEISLRLLLSEQRQELQSERRKKSFRYLQCALSLSEWQQRAGEKLAQKACNIGLVYFTRLSGVEKKNFIRAIGLFHSCVRFGLDPGHFAQGFSLQEKKGQFLRKLSHFRVTVYPLYASVGPAEWLAG